MDPFVFAFSLTLLAGLATGVGSALAFFTTRSHLGFLSASLGFSAGVMIYVSLLIGNCFFGDRACGAVKLIGNCFFGDRACGAVNRPSPADSRSKTDLFSVVRDAASRCQSKTPADKTKPA